MQLDFPPRFGPVTIECNGALPPRESDDSTRFPYSIDGSPKLRNINTGLRLPLPTKDTGTVSFLIANANNVSNLPIALKICGNQNGVSTTNAKLCRTSDGHIGIQSFNQLDNQGDQCVRRNPHFSFN